MSAQTPPGHHGPSGQGMGGLFKSGSGAYVVPLAMMTFVFFVFGFITCLNDILVPHFKGLFTLNYAQSALVQFCFFMAYFIMALPAGRVVQKIGFHYGTMAGLGIAALGCLIFYPAAERVSYPMFLGGLFVLASGITLIQVASNVYITLLGSPETASARLTFVQAFNSLGTTIAPSLGAVFILAGPAMEGAGAESLQKPYLALAGALSVLAVLLLFVKAPAIGQKKAAVIANAPGPALPAWKVPRLVLGALGIFCYVGAEVAIGSYLINFMGLPEIAGLSHEDAAHYVAFYWGGAMVGRFVGAAAMSKVAPNKILMLNASIAALLVMVTLAGSGSVAMHALISVGFFNSVMFPTIYSLAVHGLEEGQRAQGSAILNMAIVGGAVMPLLQGVFSDHFGLHHSFFLPVLCYGYIVLYGCKFYKK